MLIMGLQGVEVKRGAVASLESLLNKNASVYSNASIDHMNGYALSRAITQTIGDAQAVLITDYAKNLMHLSNTLGSQWHDVLSYMEHLKRVGRAPLMEVAQEGPNLISCDVKVCTVARTIHKSLDIRDFSGDICPIAMMFMVLKAQELGWTPEKNLFDYIKFSGKLSYFTEVGSKTEFEVVKRNH
jgi:hypothetical protein